MKDGQLENTGVRMLMVNPDTMTKRQLVKLLRSRQGPAVFMQSNHPYKVHEAEEEANRKDAAMCKEILARARTHDIHAADIGGGRRVALLFGAHRPDYKKKRAWLQYQWSWLVSDGGQEFRYWYSCIAGFKGGKAAFKAYEAEGYLPDGVKSDSWVALIEQAAAIQYHCLDRHCLAFDLERTPSGTYSPPLDSVDASRVNNVLDSVDVSRVDNALRTGINNWTQEEAEATKLYQSALSRDIHDRLDVFMARVEDDA